jgi:hypothetical protein
MNNIEEEYLAGINEKLARIETMLKAICDFLEKFDKPEKLEEGIKGILDWRE